MTGQSAERVNQWAQLGYVLQDTARRAHMNALRSADVDLLPPVAEEVLRHIIDHPAHRIQDVADGLGIAPANASAAVRRLVELGLVSKRSDPDDGRAVRLYPTDRALAGRAAVDAVWTELYTQAASSLSEESRRALLAAVPALGQLAAAVAETSRCSADGSQN